MDFKKELKILLMSQHSLIYIVTDEEQRLEYIVKKIIADNFDCFLYQWNFIEGYQNNPNNFSTGAKNPLEALESIETLNSETPKIFLLKDFHVFMNDISIIRKLKNITIKLQDIPTYIIISAPDIQIPPLLNDIVTILYFPLPNLKEIEIELKRLIEITKIKINRPIYDLALAYKGFSINKIRKSISKFISSKQDMDYIIEYILEDKKQLIKKTDILDFYNCHNKLDDIGGLINLKSWLIKRSNAFSQQAKNYGLPTPKGILLVGIQGTGKSLSAKAISKQWSIPLIRLDIGKIFAGIVGESEKRMRQMISISEQSAPCILWIDEIDKAFAKTTSNTDSGTTHRVLSSFLTWLGEKKTEVFIVATANNILALPAELIRKGRFDEIFFLDLPNQQERFSIFEIHLKKIRPLSWQHFDINSLSYSTNGFSGAEIEQAIIEAMHNAFYEKREFNTNDIQHVITTFVPLSFTDQTTIQNLQQWAKLGKVRLA